MKKSILFSLTVLAAGVLAAADSTPKDDILNAAKKLGDQPNYSWRTTFVVPEDAPYKPSPMDGKTEKDGFTWYGMSVFDNKMLALVKGDKGAINQEGAWKSFEEIDKEEGFARMPAVVVRNLKTPAKEASTLASSTKELKKEGDAYSGDLTEEGAKTMQSFRPPAGMDAPTVSDAKGSVKFWLKDGALTKYEFKLKGKMSFGGNEFPTDRTTTVEIKDVGSTKVEAPDEAKKKISG